MDNNWGLACGNPTTWKVKEGLVAGVVEGIWSKGEIPDNAARYQALKWSQQSGVFDEAVV